MIRHIIFDFDGTLADTSEGIIKTVDTTLEIMGLPPQPRAQIQATIGLPLSETIRIGGRVPEDRVDEGVRIYRENFFSVATEHIKLFPGVKETLLELHGAGLKLAIATSRGSNSLHVILQNYGIDGIFDEIATSSDHYEPKPSPDMVLKLLERLGASAGETLVVGDTTFDILMGAGALCRTCGVAYGNHDRTTLATASPDFIVDTFPEIRVAIK
ncbi:MAG: HAD family hydrolase [Bacteroidia bacterium]|nr:HAD family hydrolase [Bacteroidia bacterium]